MLLQVSPPSVDLKIRLLRAGCHCHLFVHTGDIHFPVTGHVTRDLHVADKVPLGET